MTLHGGFSCPNRDGTIGRGGCTFCNVASFLDELTQQQSISDQLQQQVLNVGTDGIKLYGLPIVEDNTMAEIERPFLY